MTEWDVSKRLSEVFRPPAWLVIPQIRNTTGFNDEIRTADAIAFSVWPSNGLYAVGIEIKVSRSDWLSELKHPEKCDAIKRYCRHWYVVAPTGIVRDGEVPDGWGYMLAGAKLRTIVAPPTLVPEPPSIGFLCSVLRSASIASPSYEGLVYGLTNRIDEWFASLRTQAKKNHESPAVSGGSALKGPVRTPAPN